MTNKDAFEEDEISSRKKGAHTKLSILIPNETEKYIKNNMDNLKEEEIIEKCKNCPSTRLLVNDLVILLRTKLQQQPHEKKQIELLNSVINLAKEGYFHQIYGKGDFYSLIKKLEDIDGSERIQKNVRNCKYDYVSVYENLRVIGKVDEDKYY